MKAHIGVDARSGLARTAGVTTGKVHDAKVMDNLIREDDRTVFADKGYVNQKKKRAARRAGVYWAVKGKAKGGAAVVVIATQAQPTARRDPRQGRACVHGSTSILVSTKAIEFSTRDKEERLPLMNIARRVWATTRRSN